MNRVTRRMLGRRRAQRWHTRLKLTLVFGGTVLVTAMTWYHLGMKPGVSFGFMTMMFLTFKVLFDPRFSDD